MKARWVAAVGGFVLLLSFSWRRSVARGGVRSDPSQAQVVRMAEVEVDPQQVKPYQAALREQIRAAVLLEPGVLTLFAVSVKDHPEQVRVFEVYASAAAYRSHLETAHFKRYKAATAGMVRSLKLVEVDPILLGLKGGTQTEVAH